MTPTENVVHFARAPLRRVVVSKRCATAQPRAVDTAEGVTAFRHFAVAHWHAIWSSNSLERGDAEIKRRANVVGIFPNDAAALLLIIAVCVDRHDEWTVSERRYLSQGSMDLLLTPTPPKAATAIARVK